MEEKMSAEGNAVFRCRLLCAMKNDRYTLARGKGGRRKGK